MKNAPKYEAPKISGTVSVPNDTVAVSKKIHPVKARMLAVAAAREKSDARRALGELPFIVGKPMHGKHHPLHGDLVAGATILDALIIADGVNFLTPKS